MNKVNLNIVIRYIEGDIDPFLGHGMSECHSVVRRSVCARSTYLPRSLNSVEGY